MKRSSYSVGAGNSLFHFYDAYRPRSLATEKPVVRNSEYAEAAAVIQRKTR